MQDEQIAEGGEWVLITADRVLLVETGREVILCDRLPDKPTLLVQKLKIEGMPFHAG